MSNEPYPRNIQLPYKVRLNWLMLSGVLAFILAGLWLIVVAEQGPPYKFRLREWSIDPQAGRVIIWVMGLASLGLGATPLVARTITRWRPRTIVISPSAITAPIRPVSSRTVTVPFATISSISRYRANGDDYLVIHHAGGHLEITGSGLPKELSLDELQGILDERRGEVR